MGEVVKLEKPTSALIEMGPNGGLLPKNFEGLWRMAQIMSVSGFMPRGMEKIESVFVAIQFGLELGLAPMQAVQNIACINGRPCVWGDAVIGLVEGSGLLESMKESFEGDSAQYPDTMTAICVVKRKGGREVTQKFSVADAKRADLWNKVGPWRQYPRRMLQMRARGFALRDLFPDVLKGLKTAEEVMDYDQELVMINGKYQVAQETTGLPAGDNSELYKPKILESGQPSVEEKKEETVSELFERLVAEKKTDPLSERVGDYVAHCATVAVRTRNQIRAKAVGNFEEFWHHLGLWVEKQAQAKTEGEEASTGDEAPQAKWDNYFRQKWVNLRKPGFAEFVQKHHADFRQSSKVLLEEARAKWADFYPDLKMPRCLWPEGIQEEETNPPEEDKPQEETKITDLPEYQEYFQSCDIDPGLAVQVKKKIFGQDKEPVNLEELNLFLKAFSSAVDEVGV